MISNSKALYDINITSKWLLKVNHLRFILMSLWRYHDLLCLDGNRRTIAIGLNSDAILLFCSFNRYNAMRDVFSLVIAASENSSRRNLCWFWFPLVLHVPFSCEERISLVQNEGMYLNYRISLSTLLYLPHYRSLLWLYPFLWSCLPRNVEATQSSEKFTLQR